MIDVPDWIAARQVRAVGASLSPETLRHFGVEKETSDVEPCPVEPPPRPAVGQKASPRDKGDQFSLF